MDKTKIMEEIKRHNVRYLKLMFVDVVGDLKNVEVPVETMDNALLGRVMVDGSSVRGFSDVHESDAFLFPDISSFRVLPLFDAVPGAVGCFMCDVYRPDGKPMEMCTRSNLKRGLEKLSEHGFTALNVGFEPEFFLFKSKPTRTILKTDFLDTGKYCADEYTDDGAIIRRELMYELQRAGFDCAASHHERSTSQHEITYKFSDALSACDNLVLVKFLIKVIAKRHGYTATFMPKPVSGINGSGLHTNLSLSSAKVDNVFADKAEGISTVAKSFLAGVICHAKSLCFLTNPTINSYKRLVAGYEAPVTICWSGSNRSAMIRVPKASGSATRIEVRNPDASCNPYTAVAGILAAGLDGVSRGLEAPAPTDFNLFELDEHGKKKLKLGSLPTCLTEALDEFNKGTVVKQSMSVRLCEVLLKVKTDEIEEYKTRVNDFDIEHYYDV